MGKRGHLPSFGNVVKCFCALVVTAKRSVDELFIHYSSQPVVSFYGGFVPRIHLWTPLGDFRTQTPNLPTTEKKILRAPMFEYETNLTCIAAENRQKERRLHRWSHRTPGRTNCRRRTCSRRNGHDHPSSRLR